MHLQYQNTLYSTADTPEIDLPEIYSTEIAHSPLGSGRDSNPPPCPPPLLWIHICSRNLLDLIIVAVAVHDYQGRSSTQRTTQNSWQQLNGLAHRVSSGSQQFSSHFLPIMRKIMFKFWRKILCFRGIMLSRKHKNIIDFCASDYWFIFVLGENLCWKIRCVFEDFLLFFAAETPRPLRNWERS